MGRKKKFILIIIVIFVALLVSGASYAFWVWTSNVNKNVVFNTMGNIEEHVVYNEGNSYFVGNFQPTTTFCQSTSTTISFYKKEEISDVNLVATINMKVNSVGSNIASSDDVYWVVTSGGNSISCTDGLTSSSVLDYGTFNGVDSGDTIPLLENVSVPLTEQQYTIWIWIDSSGSGLSSLSGDTIDTNIWTEITMDRNEPNSPILDEGMIPVTIADNGTVTTVSSDSSSWYNYSEKKWANVVLVNSNSRNNYLNTNGVTVSQSDILAYYVWIPRYKYKIWNKAISVAGEEVSIDILFESQSSPLLQGTAITSYRTHPAFWWDDNNDELVTNNELLPGIWVGKFETTGSISEPTILPNSGAIIEKTLSSLFSTSLIFAGGTLTASNGNVTFIGNDTYGLTTETNSHIMKNVDWGAVAYLSHSIYGINGVVRNNNYFDADNSVTMTGCGAASLGAGSVTTCSIPFGGATSYPQSTTGNITGVFDMSGGAIDNVMGNFNNTVGSGSGFTVMPERKYYDLYTNSDSALQACSGNICYGHALSETSSWYDTSSSILNSSYVWYWRGSFLTLNLFSRGRSSGLGSTTYHNGFHSVLVPIMDVS